TRRDEEVLPFVAGVRRNYIIRGICGIAANASIKVCMFYLLCTTCLDCSHGVRRNYIFPQALLAFIVEHEYLFTATEYTNLLKVQVPGREIHPDAQDRVSEIL
ncbi:LOW QUALITY PROTEIN: hypothetical protein CFOL_v3_34282, partial [Cephalotus follicularis]